MNIVKVVFDENVIVVHGPLACVRFQLSPDTKEEEARAWFMNLKGVAIDNALSEKTMPRISREFNEIKFILMCSESLIISEDDVAEYIDEERNGSKHLGMSVEMEKFIEDNQDVYMKWPDSVREYVIEAISQ